jgi:hypothetical protein
MKRFLNVLALLLLIAGLSYSQVTTNQYGVTFNQARVWFTEANATDATADRTTGYLTFAPATEIGLIGRATDSLNVHISYQLRNSVTGAVQGSATLLDSCVYVVDEAVTSDTSTVETGLGVATLRGYDQVRFVLDFDAATPGTSDGDDGTANLFRLYYILYKP